VKVNCAIIGASGYTGLELIRLLEFHPYISLVSITSRSYAGKSLKEVTGLNGKYENLLFEEPEIEKITKKVDLVFLCIPSGNIAFQCLENNVKVIDLSADFRFKHVETYEKTYKISHKYPFLCEEAVYGLTEIFKEEIKNARLVANPGCYPTSILLPLMPLVKEKLIDHTLIIADSKSGVSGAGRKADYFYSFCEVNEDFKAYKIASHRHTPEIEEKLSQILSEPVKVVFTPHLLPINRGIFSTIYVKPKESTDVSLLKTCLKDYYKESTFVEIIEDSRIPTISEVKGTNFCKINLYFDKEREMVIIVSVIDNLVKGASGQALQNFNLMFGFEEDLGLPKSCFFV